MSTLSDLSAVASRLAALHSRRDTLARQARSEGHSQRKVAEAAGLSHAAIARIEKRG